MNVARNAFGILSTHSRLSKFGHCCIGLFPTTKPTRSLAVMAASKALLIGISGPSSSGKTTLSRLLRDILPTSFILHEDDFYKTDTEIPNHPTARVQDWDCLESINLPALDSALRHIRANGTSPPDFQSKEDQNSVGKSGVDESVVNELKARAKKAFAGTGQVAIIDGFLLFSEEMKEIRSLFDVKLFLRTNYATAKQRREERSGYVTLEGFWEDPPGYVDKVVWPNYVKDHAFLFEKGGVESDLKSDVCKPLGIHGMPKEAYGDMTKCLEWAYGILEKELLQRKET